MRRSYTYVSVVLIVVLLMMPMALEINSMTRFAQNFTYPTISIPAVLKNALRQYGKIEIQKSNDIYFVTPPFTGVDININLNGSSLLQYGIANETLPPDENFTASIENFLNSLNESSTLSIIVTVSSFNESMMLYSAYRNFLDIALEWAETTSDAVVIVANDKATPANIIELLKLAQLNENITEINMVVLTHGILANETHGMLLWDKDGPKIVEPSLLYQYHVRVSKLNFVFLPFCSVEDEFEIYENNSIKGFFLNIGADEVIGGTGELALDAEYLSWVQDILLGGTWFDEYGYFEIPVYDNESEEWVTLVMEYNFSVAEETLPVIQGNETSLGISISSGGGRSYRTISKRTSVSVAIRKGVSRTTVRRISTAKVGIKSWTHISGRAKLSMIEGYIIDGDSSHKSKKTSNSIDAKLNSYKSKIEKAKKEALGSFVVADKIISKIYGGYVAAKSKLKRMIYKYFNWIYGFPASLIWSVILSKVLKGVDWLISRISHDRKFKSLISVAYNMLKAGKSSWELALTLIGWGVTKFASSILKYFGNFTNWILSKFGSVGNWLKKLIKGWVDSAMSFVSSKLAYFEKKLKNSLNIIAQSIGNVIVFIFEFLKQTLRDFTEGLIKHIRDRMKSNDLISAIKIVKEDILRYLDKIDKILFTVNIAQLLAGILTGGISEIVNRLLVPMLIAVISNMVLPKVIKDWVGIEIEFNPITFDDLLNIALNGWKGLLEFLIPHIFLVIQYVSLLNEIINITKKYGISKDTLISALSGMDAMGALMVLISILVGYNIMKFAKTAFGRDAEKVLREFNGIFESIIDDDYRVTEGSINLSNKVYFVKLQKSKLEEVFDALQNAFFNFIHNILNTGKKIILHVIESMNRMFEKNARMLELLKIMIIENAPSLSMLSLLNMSLFAIYYSKNNNVSGRYLKYLKLFEKIMDEHFINTKLKAVMFSIIFMLLGGIYKTTVLRLESDWSHEFPQLADYFNFIGSITDTIYSMLTYLIDYMVEYLKPKVHESLKVGPVEKFTDAVRGTWKLLYERFISTLFKNKKGILLLLSAKTAILLSLFYNMIYPILPLMSPTFQDNNRSKDELLAATSVQLAVLLTVTTSSIEVKRLRENLGLKIPVTKKQSTKKYERIEKIATPFFLLAKLYNVTINKTDKLSYTVSNALAFTIGVIELYADFRADAGVIENTNIECDGGFSFIDLFKALSLGTILAKITITRQMLDIIIDAIDQATS